MDEQPLRICETSTVDSLDAAMSLFDKAMGVVASYYLRN